jgi:CubicO group peptidase (beta-lactamase class C family)
MIEQVTKRDLDSYMREYIWQPLGMISTTFRLQSNLDIQARKASMTTRDASGMLNSTVERYSMWFPEPDSALDDHGGAGVFSCPADYMKLLTALLDNNGSLLRPASIDLLFTPCLSPMAAEKLQENRSAHNRLYEGLEMAVQAPTKVNHTLGGMLTEQDVLGGRKAGSLAWGGIPNLSWIIDPKSQLALFYASQQLPQGDLPSARLIKQFEAAVYSGEFFEGASPA